MTFDENVALGKARETPPPLNVERKDDAMDVQEEPPMPDFDLAYDPMEPMDPLDPPP